MALRCETCPKWKKPICQKLNHPIKDGFAMLYHGGREGEPSRCGIEKES